MQSQHRVLVKADDGTDTSYGYDPHQRPLPEHIKLGVINLDKPLGPTSHQVVAWVKKILDVEKAGHGGTLDPRVTGVLPTALLRATKALPLLLHGKKEYVGVMTLHKDVKPAALYRVCRAFTGQVSQLPPVRSAVKRQRRMRTIYVLDILEIENRSVLFKVRCDAGTYIRTLVHDIGRELRTGAHLRELRRTSSSQFHESDCVTLQALKDAYVYWQEEHEERGLRAVIQPMERLVSHMGQVVVKDSAVDAICHGANVALPGILKVSKMLKKHDAVAITSLKGEGIAMGDALMSADEMMHRDNGYAVSVQRVFMERGTYPRAWKRKSGQH